MFYYRVCLQKKLCVAPSLLSIKGIKKGTDEMSQQSKIFLLIDWFDGNKAKGRISTRVFQENKEHQIFQITNISYPLI